MDKQKLHRIYERWLEAYANTDEHNYIRVHHDDLLDLLEELLKLKPAEVLAYLGETNE